MVSSASPVNSPRMLTSKFLLSTGILLVLTTLTGVWGNGCNNTDTQALPVINPCEEETWTMGRIYFNITTANMGSNTRCNCTLRSKSPGVTIRTTCALWEIDPNAHRCGESFIQMIGAAATNLTCTSAIAQAYTSGLASDEVTITLGRADTSVEMSYCFYLYPDGWSAFDMELTCQSDAPPESSTATTPSSASVSSSSTPSTQMSILSSSTHETLTAVRSTTESSTTSNSATSLTLNSGGNDSQEQKFPIGPVAGGVGGAVVLIIIVVVVVVVVFRKRRGGGGRKPAGQRHPEAEDHGQDNPGFDEEEDLDDPRYSTAGEAASGTERSQARAMMPSSSQTASAHSVPAASSNPYEFEDDAPLDHGAVNMDARTGSASVTLGARDSHPPTYAVVSKPRGREPQKPPLAKKPPKPAGLSTSSKSADVTGAAAAGGGDVYAVVDKSRTRGGNARTNASSLPLAVAAPPPVPEASASASPGLVYADLEEVRGEGRQSAPPRPLANMATETEYAVIDHSATAKFSSEA